MALLNSSSLLIYLEIDEADPPPFPSSSFLVGLFDAPDAATICLYTTKTEAWLAKNWFFRMFTPRPVNDISEPAATCKAAAYILDNGKFLQVLNVGAERGFGPTLYAAILELARTRGREGVIPSSDPDKILERPKRIWEQFCRGPQYQGKVLSDSVPGQHPEPWLNRAYRLAPGASLLDYIGKRTEWKAYSSFWEASRAVTGWRGKAFDMARRSVEAHVSGILR